MKCCAVDRRGVAPWRRVFGGEELCGTEESRGGEDLGNQAESIG